MSLVPAIIRREAHGPATCNCAKIRLLSPWNEYFGGRASLLNFARYVEPSGTCKAFSDKNSRIKGGSAAGISGLGFPPPPVLPSPPPPPDTPGVETASDRMEERKL